MEMRSMERPFFFLLSRDQGLKLGMTTSRAHKAHSDEAATRRPARTHIG